jgi:hypothetical protein
MTVEHSTRHSPFRRRHNGRARRWLGAFCALAAIAFALASCAPESALRAVDPTAVTVPQGQGLLVARVVFGTTTVPFSNLGRVTAQVRSVPDDHRTDMTSKSGRQASHAVFLEPLPPGRYRLVGMTADTGTTHAPLELAPFDIEAGRVTDLGGIALMFTAVGNTGATYRVAQMPTPEDTDATLATMNAGEVQRLSRQPPLRPSLIASQINAAIINDGLGGATITAGMPVRDGQRIAFGRTLGLVSLWEPTTQKWRNLWTGRSLPVQSIDLDGDGSPIVGMESGVLLAMRQGKWTSITPPVPHAAVRFIGRAGNGEYLAMADDRNDFVVASSPSLQEPVWTELRRFPIDRNLNPGLDGSAQARLTKERLVVFHNPGGRFTSYTAHSFDLATRQWQAAAMEGYMNYAPRFDAFDGGTIVTIGGTAITRALAWSDDWGSTWSRKPVAGFALYPAFRDTRTIYLRVGGLYGATSKTFALSKSEDGGASWVPMGDLPGECREIYALPKPGFLLAVTIAGNTYLSTDDGRSWTPHRI